MRVLIVNTSERTGGAAVAANRLMEALNMNGAKAKMLVRDKETDHITVAQLPHSCLSKWNFLWERWCLFCHLHFSRKHLFEVDMANAGSDITALPEFQEADIIHLNWINQGMLSLKGIRKILASGKPVVWTMHDIWPATAICHVTLECENFHRECRNCWYLPSGGSKKDFSTKIWKRKKAVLKGRNITFVACSHWLEEEAKASALLVGQWITSIPNPIDIRLFKPANKAEARSILGLPADKRLILFVSQRVTNAYKGMDYLIEACRKMVAENPQMRENTAVVVLGGHAEELSDSFDLPVFPLGYVNDSRQIVNVYNAADVFVLPSLSENLPNTIMEAMACGVPCVGFKVGGIPEEIDHKLNGYVAEYRDADDLAKGISWVLDTADTAMLSKAAVHKVVTTYSQQTVAMKYINIYNKVLTDRKLEI
ncbi:MAG: glycosyltransferase family 4 protein [Prevotella sp.]|jgi:glycosyltransferase involved in cell wall biosynthesis|nr:glycosyltransferase family 4 protein [Prevotella sp.]MCI1282122.1 glycosyltransferase family 4 protein [Prevotella sp.]